MGLTEIISVASAAISAAAAAYSLHVGLKSLRVAASSKAATEAQATSSIEALRLAIQPYIAVYTRSYTDQSENTYLFVENVGNGAAIDVEIKVLHGEDFNPTEAMPLIHWRPIDRGIEVLRQRERLYTFLMDTKLHHDHLSKRLVIAASYKDIKGHPYNSGPFEIDLVPGGGTQWATSTRERNGQQVSYIHWKPSEP